MLEQYVSLPIPNPNANIHSEEEWKGISREIEEIIVDSGCGNDSKDIILIFSDFRKQGYDSRQVLDFTQK